MIERLQDAFRRWQIRLLWKAAVLTMQVRWFIREGRWTKAKASVTFEEKKEDDKV